MVRFLQYAFIAIVTISVGFSLYQWNASRASQTLLTNTSSARPTFEAPLTTDLNLSRGIGSATYSRADGADRRATVTDFEGLIRTVKNGEARFEGARRVENLLTYSEALDNAAWVKQAGVSISANATTAPDGTVTADKIVEDTSTGGHAVYNSFTKNAASQVYAFSVYIKPDGRNWVRQIIAGLSGTNGVAIYFNASNGSFGSSASFGSGFTLLSYGSQAMANGYYRLYLLVSSDTTIILTSQVFLATGDNVASYTGDGSSGMYYWGAQVEEVTGQANQNPSEYVSTNVKTASPYHGANVDGVKYFATQNGNTVASHIVTEATGTAIPDATLRGFLAEGQRVNLALQSESMDNASWQKTGGSASGANIDSGVAPSGQTTAEKFIEDTSTGQHYTATSGGISVTSGTAYTFSVFVKPASGTRRIVLYGTSTYFNKSAIFNLSTASVASSSWELGSTINAVGNGWYRLSVSGVAISTGSSNFFVYLDDGSVNSYTGDGSSGVYLWGAQLEAALFPSSYIPTTTASVTRASDVLSYQSSGNALGTAGTLSAESGTVPWANDGTDHYFLGTGPIQGLARYSGGDIKSNDGTSNAPNIVTWTDKSAKKVALAWSGSTRKGVADGDSVVSGAFDGDMLDGVTSFYIGTFNSGYGFLFSTIKNVRAWKQAMSDAFLTNLTAGKSGVIKQSTKKSPLDTGLVGYWSFDENTGTQAGDASGNNNTGTLVNSPTWTTGKLGQAVSFNGSTQAASAPVNLSSTAIVSVSFWLKWTAFANDDKIALEYTNNFNSKNGFVVSPNAATGVFSFGISKTGSQYWVDGFTRPSAGVWHHYVFIMDRDTRANTAYVDGVLQSLTTVAHSVVTMGNFDNSTFYFMSRGTTSLFGAGSLDDVRIYNRVLSETEITNLYNLGATKLNTSQNAVLTSGLVGLWSFNGQDTNWTSSSAGTVSDRSGSGNTGTLTNMSRSTSTARGKVGQALTFDGTDDYITASDNATLDADDTADLTLTGWFYRNSATTDDTIIAKRNGIANTDDGYILYIDDSTDKLTFETSENSGTDEYQLESTTSFTTPGWYHYAVVWDQDSAANSEIYLSGVTNGATDTGTIGNLGDLSNALSFNIGSESDAGNPFDGRLDETRIYNRALSESEIWDLYQSSGGTVNTCKSTSVADADGNTYGTIQIGSQCWMKQNMRVGTRIGVSTSQTNNATTEKYCYSDSDANCTSNNPNQPDGGLYQWDEAMQYSTTAGARGICPAGWHIPTDTEWYVLEHFLDSTIDDPSASGYRGTDGGTKLKPNGTSGFEGNLAGRAWSGAFSDRTTYGFFWSSSESGVSAWNRVLGSVFASVNRSAYGKAFGLSVRCLQD